MAENKNVLYLFVQMMNGKDQYIPVNTELNQ